MSIEGLQSTVNGVELRLLCKKRSEYHVKRANEYHEQAEMFKDDTEELAQNKGSSSPRRDLLTKADDHSDKGKFLEFVGNHVMDGEEYSLSKSDLATLGIIKSGY